MADYNKIFSDDLVAGAAIRDDQGRVISTTYATMGDVDSTLGTKVSALETKVSSLETTTTSLSSRLGMVETTTTSLSSKVSTLTSKVSTLETTATSLSSRLSTTQSSLATTQSSLATTQSSLASLTSTVSSHITDTATALELKADKSDTYTKEQVDNLIAVIPKFAIEVVETLPTQNISYTTLYLVPDSSSSTGQLYTEWIYVKGSGSTSDHWERLGIQRIDLSNYYTKTEIDTTVTTLSSNIAAVATRATALETTTTSLSSRVGTLETTTTSLSSRVTTLETSKQDKLSTSQMTAINMVVDLGLNTRTFTNWESET